MKIQRYPLAGEEPARLELRWEGLDAHVYLDGAHAGTLRGSSGLKEGWSAQLDDGSRVEVRTIRRVLFPELSVLRNGLHVPSSPSHPDRMLRSCSNAIFIVSAFLLVTAIFSSEGFAWLDVLFSMVYFAGGLLLRNRRRLGAAVISIPLFIRLDLLLIALFVQPVDRAWFIELGLNLLFTIFVVRSYQAARDSRAYQVANARA
jgi:hypothetical protein